MNGHDPGPVSGGGKSRIARRFDESVESLDTATSNRLRLMRRNALSTPAHHASSGRRWLPAAAVATVFLFAALAWIAAPSPPGPSPVVQSEDIAEPFLAADDEIELYAWLGEAPVAVETSGEKPL